MGAQVPFWIKSETDFYELASSTAKYKNNIYYLLGPGNSYHLLNIYLVYACAVIISLSKVSNLFQKTTLFYFKPILVAILLP